MRWVVAVAMGCAAALPAGSLAVDALAAGQAAPAAPSAIVFTDATASAGITFTHNNGAFGKKYLPETMGPGVAVLDVDNDGFQDLFFVNGKNWPGHPASGGKPARSRPALYRNDGNGRFTDVTQASGLDVALYGLGAAAADYDNDGRVDLFVTALGGNRLFRNIGPGSGPGKGSGDGKGPGPGKGPLQGASAGAIVFADVTAKAGVGVGASAPSFPASAAWVDYDKDGWLDLVVLSYVQWTIAGDRFCSLDGKTKSYCTPETYKGESPRLYRNRRDGTFADVTRAAGLYDPASKALGIALIDYDADGWLDLFVANDTQPNRLYRNSGKGTFTDEAVAAGVAFNEAGVARAGMGVDAGDYDGSGRESLVIGNFSNEMMALYHNEGGKLFLDEAPGGTIGRTSMLSLTFACFFFDYDLDGRLDIFAGNGHVADDIATVQPKVTHAQAPHLFRNAGNKRFEVADGGPALKERVVARGAAYVDYDLDGDLDLVVMANGGRARLLRNDGGNRSRALRLTLEGAPSNRSAIGARAIVRLEGGATRRAMVKTGSSYLSQSELPLTFGLGDAAKVAGIDIQWPGGAVERLPAVDANQHLTVREGQGIVKRRVLGQQR